ncbi:MAG: hypothetical protein ACPG8A_03320 [Psychrobium sp.]
MLDQETYDSLPDVAKAGFAQDGDKFIPVKDAALKKSMNELDAKLKGVTGELESYKSTEAERIEAAKAEAMKQAQSKGDIELINKQHEQQMADLKERTTAQVKAEALLEFRTESAKKDASNLADKIGMNIGVDKESQGAVSDLIRHRIIVDPETGKKVFHDKQGSALSVDQAGFEAQVAIEYPRLAKSGVVTDGGGAAMGSGGKTPTQSASKNDAFNQLPKR